MKAKFKERDRVILKPKYRRKRHEGSECVGIVLDVENTLNERKCYEVKFDDTYRVEAFYSYELDLVESAEEERKVVASLMQTPDGTILWSRFTHDYVRYHDKVSDEDYMLDGGTSYCRFVDSNKVPAKDMSVYSDDSWELQRQYILRGTFDKAGNRVWVPICKLSNDHIKNLVTDSGLRTDTPYFKELEYRENNHIEVSEHDYKNEGVESLIKKA